MATLSPKKVSVVKKFYVQDMMSAPEIAQKLKVSLDAVYYCLRREKVSRRSASDNNRLLFEKKKLSFKLKKQLTVDEQALKTIGTILYWGEGYKTSLSNGIDFANSDPEMVAVFLQFLRRVCGVDESRLRVYLYCYANQKPHHLVLFWSKLLSIDRKQFTKPYVRTDFRKEKRGKMPHGLVHIRYADKKLLRLLREWIDECKEAFCVGTQVVNGGSL